MGYPNVAAMAKAKVGFVAPAAKAYANAETLAAQRVDRASEVDYVAARDARRLPAERGRWFVREDLTRFR